MNLRQRVALLEADMIDAMDRLDYLTQAYQRMAGRWANVPPPDPQEDPSGPPSDEELLALALRDIASGDMAED